MPKNNEQPFKAFGAKIKHFREQWKQSLDEVSNTLEINEILLQEIESGKILPSDNLLNMMINHFLLTEEQSDELRQLANLHDSQSPESLAGGIEDMVMKQIVMYMPLDQKVAYTDGMNVTVNRHGVVLQFTQTQESKIKPVVVSQVGMSREHAEKVVEVLSKTLKEHNRGRRSKFLPSSKPKNKNKH